MPAKRIRAGSYVMHRPTGDYFIERRAGGVWWVTGFDHDGLVLVSDGLWKTKAAAMRVTDAYDSYFRFASAAGQR